MFATVADPRAAAFLDVVADELEDDAALFACACGLAREPERAAVKPVWQTANDAEPLDLVAALREARRPYDEDNARWQEARRREREPDHAEREALACLVDHCRSQQLKQVAELTDRLGEGPALRRVRRRLDARELLSAVDLGWLRSDAKRDREARTRQERQRAAYLERREEEARHLAKAQGLTGRLRRRPADFLDEVDRRLLRFCGHCEEIAYPGADEGRAWSKPGDPAGLCHFCGQGELEPFEGGG